MVVSQLLRLLLLLLLLLLLCSVQVAAALLPSGSGGSTPSSSTYSGGVLSCLAPGVVPTVAVAYEAKGGLADIKSAAIAAVLKQLLNETAEVLPQMKKKAEAPLTSIAPVVEVREGGKPSGRGVGAAGRRGGGAEGREKQGMKGRGGG